MSAQLKNEEAQLQSIRCFSHDVQDGSRRGRAKLEAVHTATDKDISTLSEYDSPYSDLSDDETAILKRQVETPDTAVGALAVYRYATAADIWILSISCLLSIASGVTMPLMVIVFGNIQSTLQDYFHGSAGNDFSSQLNHVVLYFVYLAIASFVLTYTYTVGFIYTGEHVTAKIRGAYLEHCLRQNIAFFDNAGTGEIVTRLTEDTNMIQEAISQKAGRTLAGISTFVAAFVVAFVTQWKLTLILVSVFIMMVLNMGLGSRLMVKYSRLTMEAYAPGASLVEEAISSIRNTVAFGAQERLTSKLDTYLMNSEVYGFRSKVAMGLMMAGVAAIVNLGYALAFWVGGQYVVYGGLPVSKVFVTAMVILMGAFSLGNVATNAQAIAGGLAAARKVYNTIDRQSPLDPFDTSGKELSEVQGSLRLRGVTHIFPSRPEVVVLDNVSLTVPCRKTTALVGASGSGKSTIVALVERFYEPLRGTISLDGHDISTLNLRWLRRQISLVGQEPTLFNTSIFNNIKHGLIGTDYEQQSAEVQRARVVDAAKKANAHHFISSLPEGYETDVGARGGLLSGGQKQRIVIARAIVSDPKVLLLDEATSALDSKSERLVQEALDAASEGRTTIVIAHRLSTIKGADNIVVMSKGGIVEQGTHHELLARHGAYYDLITVQSTTKQADETDSEADDTLLMANPEKALGHGVEDKFAEDLPIAVQDSASVLVQHNEPTTPNRYSLWEMVKLILGFNRKETALLIIGALSCIVSGGGVPVQCVLLAKALSNLSTPLDPSNLHRLKKESDLWAAIYLILAGVLALSYSIHGVLFARCSERLVHRARYAVFRSFLRQDISFFDEAHNAAGGLTTFLSTKTSDIAGLSGAILGSLLISSTALIAGLTIGITIGWRLSLVCASTVPALVLCGYFQVYICTLFERRSTLAYSESAIYASEAVSAMPTLASLTREGEVLGQYRDMLDKQQQASLRSVLRSSALFALSESLTLLILALCFWYGGTLIAKGEYSMFQYFACFSSVIFSAQSAGVFFSHASNMSKAYAAAQELKELFEREPVIDTWSVSGEPIAGCEGHVEFRGVHFHYPGRPGHPVLSGIDMNIQSGQHVALVGPSGCGKSTSISLIERFYDPTKGGIFLDGKNISTLNVNQYRGFAALVSQEPTLYQGTIRENILLGVPDHEVVPESRIIKACYDANIYSFVASLPDGFDTIIGSKGVLLSGGQKQRLAIARALIRDPRILLLDEATSALDSESEATVQAALDKAAKGRTTITVAHRLSTIKKADTIYVFDKGRIVEQGTYGELILMNGHFAELISLQNLDENA